MATCLPQCMPKCNHRHHHHRTNQTTANSNMEACPTKVLTLPATIIAVTGTASAVQQAVKMYHIISSHPHMAPTKQAMCSRTKTMEMPTATASLPPTCVTNERSTSTVTSSPDTLSAVLLWPHTERLTPAAARGLACTDLKPEIQCRSVSQSSRASMPPDTYRRTLEYVQQCQQLAATNAIEGPGVQDFPQVQPAAAVSHPPPAQPAIPASQPVARVQASATLQQSDTPAQAPMVLSPGCNKVTSTTDKSEVQSCHLVEGVQQHQQQQTQQSTTENCSTVPSPKVSPSKAAVQKNPVNSARALSARENRLHPHSPLLCTSNMVINDMSATLSSLMQETKCLQLLQ
ncbi:hypothetical protein HPB50_007925 [Hyalomma asiaticum]|uniref:Uncharacterized protein n=1 Tax=Hyalomma asiaticum TaxID=266040 RepID=A0ACB7S5U2_HYAAI|nr:hypothetical protein HPB50_007925 [Hyalomma asiaticum]